MLFTFIYGWAIHNGHYGHYLVIMTIIHGSTNNDQKVMCNFMVIIGWAIIQPLDNCTIIITNHHQPRLLLPWCTTLVIVWVPAPPEVLRFRAREPSTSEPWPAVQLRTNAQLIRWCPPWRGLSEVIALVDGWWWATTSYSRCSLVGQVPVLVDVTIVNSMAMFFQLFLLRGTTVWQWLSILMVNQFDDKFSEWWVILWRCW